MNKKAANLGIVLLVIGLIILVTVGVLFFYGRKEAPQAPLPSPTNPKMHIDDLKMCYDVFEDYSCWESSDKTFRIGDSFYVYFTVNNLEGMEADKGYKIGFIEDSDILDPNGELVKGIERKNILDIERIAKNPYHNSIPVKNGLIFDESDIEGQCYL